MVSSLHPHGKSCCAFKICSQAHVWKCCSCIISWMITHEIVCWLHLVGLQGWLFQTQWLSLTRDIHHPGRAPSLGFVTALVLSSEIKHIQIKLHYELVLVSPPSLRSVMVSVAIDFLLLLEFQAIDSFYLFLWMKLNFAFVFTGMSQLTMLGLKQSYVTATLSLLPSR